MRLAKIMAHRNLCSRREAEKLISAGKVQVNGEVITELGRKWPTTIDIKVAKDEVESILERVTLILNKPLDYVSHLPEPGQRDAVECVVAENYRGKQAAEQVSRWCALGTDLSVAGRLDRASRGLLILTRDGRVVKSITSLGKIEKVYQVRVERDVEERHLQELENLRSIRGKDILPMRVRLLDQRKIEFKLVEGKKHQIRRACRAVGLNVLDLFREQVGPLTLKGLRPGQWREINEYELQTILNA